MIVSSLFLAALVNLWPPPAPLPDVDDETSETEAPPPVEDEAPPPAEDTAPPPPTEDARPPADDAGAPPATRVPPSRDTPQLDERGDPILPYGEVPGDGEALPYATETPPEPELPYATEDELEDEPMGYDASVERPPPPKEAVEREGQAAVEDSLAAPSAESKQRFALEVKFGPYLPSVDRNSTAEYGPYAQIFGRTDENGQVNGQPKRGLFSVVGFEWQFYDFGGPFSIGTTVGFFRDRAAGLLVEPDEDGSFRSRADRVSFGVVPVTVLLGYRFELLADRYRVPLVPYARAGLGYAFWWSRGGDKKISVNSEGEKGRGGSLGWQANLGMMLRLDFLDRGSTRSLDQTTGINHTYIFGEWQFSHLDGFGSDKRMAVGDDTWLAGLAIAF